MKGVFCNLLKGSWPNWQKFIDNGIKRVYIDARELKADGSSRLLELVEETKKHGLEPGIYRDPSWNDLTAPQLAQKAHQDLVAAGCTSTQPCAYMFDVEYHNNQYILDLLAAWRKPRPYRDTQWTFEPFQAGWFSDELIARVNADSKLTLLPQAYLGTPNMYPCAHDAVKANVVDKLGQGSRVEVVYDGLKGAPVGFSGAIFTDTRLP